MIPSQKPNGTHELKARFFLRSLLCVFLLSCGIDRVHAQAPLLLENPTLSKTQISFSYGGDIWTVDRRGGSAQRLTADPAREIFPIFSPDGSKVAFARLNPLGGPSAWDVYVASIGGGEERRITYHPDVDLPVNWTPDGKNILISVVPLSNVKPGRPPLYRFRARRFPNRSARAPWMAGLVFSWRRSHCVHSANQYTRNFRLAKLSRWRHQSYLAGEVERRHHRGDTAR